MPINMAIATIDPRHRWCAGLSTFEPQNDDTMFDREVKRLGLMAKEAHWPFSVALRVWCKRNCNWRYVPEWLLKEYGLEVRDTSGMRSTT